MFYLNLLLSKWRMQQIFLAQDHFSFCCIKKALLRTERQKNHRLNLARLRQAWTR